ncbi:AmpG family muropeptide MFS transporter [Exilibacterium tricleocarpae]|uniref:AmpG family muropeptide MFS transporter n=1 Tax=Exilibacterium tricleocarpae TaxID=2591008 RepID=A0A545TQI9_9GAMM|nr:AmpG family muropeptide MFS transporter [Exilibacterium tricleocarpae]TQV79478.1 AmpG family muropeptide MFS transporter [Exilibacterium tricleocarpae]
MADSAIQNAIFNRRTLICIFTGFSSGLPFFLLIQLVPAWLRKEGVGLAEIGLFSLVGLPYVWKFVWSPLLDRFQLPLLGLRRGWMLLSQFLLLISIAALPWLDLHESLWSIAYLATAVAFFSATQDIVLDAYRRELLPDAELGFGNSVHINAYRMAGFIPGALSLIMADHFSWQFVFGATSLFMLIGMVLTLVIKEPVHDFHPDTLHDAVVDPFKEFFSRQGVRQALWILAFLFFYKLGDNMATALSTPFYIDLGFSLTEIGLIAKNAALWPMLFGSIAGGIIMIKIGINRALWLFGLVQLVSILGFALLAHVGANNWVLALVISFEYLGVGLGTAASVAFIARTTSKHYTATQFALFTAIAALPRTLANTTTGFLVEQIGWESFFYLCAVLALPGMALLIKVAPWHEHPVPTTREATP